MRRKRRQSTRLQKKKSITLRSTPLAPSLPKSSNKFRRFSFLIFLFIITTIITYSIYYYSFERRIPVPEYSPIVPEPNTTMTAIEDSNPTPPPFTQKIQIEILNGCGVTGIAKVFQAYLRSQGFDVVNTENYIENGKRRWDVKESMIIHHLGDIDQARDVALSLGISDTKILSSKNPTAIYDVSVVIGKDYKNLRGSK